MTRYNIVLIAEDGEYVLRDGLLYQVAVEQLKKLEKNYGEGQRLVIREVSNFF